VHSDPFSLCLLYALDTRRGEAASIVIKEGDTLQVPGAVGTHEVTIKIGVASVGLIVIILELLLVGVPNQI
jgi:hypothetical protein